MKISRVALSIETSFTRKLFNMASQYDDVINLTLGDPDLPPPKNVQKAAMSAIDNHKTRYSANAGLIETRQAFADNLYREFGVKADVNKEVCITTGGMCALYLAISAMVDPGDEVIIVAPYYVNYCQMIKMCGGLPVVVNTKEENGFSVISSDIEKVITEKTVAIIINSPSNPTGEVLSKKTIQEIVEISRNHNLYIISDEVYRSLIYDGLKHESILNTNGGETNAVFIDSCSKQFAMTGYRLGFIYSRTRIVEQVIKMQENVVACAPLPSQYAAIEAFSLETDSSYILTEFQKRRDYFAQEINNIGGLSCRIPKGTFYLFVNISKLGLGSVDFAYKLLENQQVAVVPGITYGEAYDDYVRMAFTLEKDKLEEAVKRISDFTKGTL